MKKKDIYKYLTAAFLLTSPAFAGDVNLSWVAPTQNEDGTPLVDLAGFKIYRGNSTGGPYSEIVDIADPLATTYVDPGLSDGTYYYVATAYNESNVESVYSGEATKTISDTPLIPSPPTNTRISVPPDGSWTLTDIGTPATPGTIETSGGTITITASGFDIWGSDDEFTYFYIPITGDVDATVRVVSVSENGKNWNRGAIMIRETLDTNSAHVKTHVRAGGDSRQQRRFVTGGSSSSTVIRVTTAPEYLRIRRQGDVFDSWSSETGLPGSWGNSQSSTVSMSETVYIGLATLGIENALTTVVYDNLCITNAGTQECYD